MTTQTEKTPRHQWLNANGEVVEGIEAAAGVRYVTDAGETVDVLLRSEQLPMLAAFGARTLVTNTVSSFYGPKPEGAGKDAKRPRKDDAPDSDAVGVRERFAAITADDWGAERGGGAGGVGYNLDDLASALEEVITAAGGTFNRDRVSAALREGGTFKGSALDAKAYRKAVYGVAGVKEAYAALRAAKAAPTSTVEEVADDFA